MRHGQSEFNNLNIFCGWLDAHLTPKGQDQARSSAELIKQFDLIPDHVFTSKLTRTCQTARIIMEQLDREWIDVDKSWRLNERHYGALQGRDKSQVLAELGEEEYMHVRRAYDGVPPLVEHEGDRSLDDRYKDVLKELPKGESLQMVIERLEPYLKSQVLPVLQSGKTVLIVAHGSTVRAVLKVVKGLSEEEIKNVNIPNGIPMCLEVDDHLRSIGRDFYLDPEDAKKRAAEVAKEGFSSI